MGSLEIWSISVIAKLSVGDSAVLHYSGPHGEMRPLALATEYSPEYRRLLVFLRAPVHLVCPAVCERRQQRNR